MRWLFPIGMIGSVLAALCCAGILTPVLVALLVALGLGALTQNLDLVIFAALAVFLILAYIGWQARKVGPPYSQGA